MDDADVSTDLSEKLEEHRRGGGSRGTLAVSPREGYVGDDITIKGRNFPAGQEYDIRWNSVDGKWGVLRGHEIVGPQFQPRTETILTVETDDNGSFDVEWTIPEDYGGGHRIEAVTGRASGGGGEGGRGGEPVAEAEIEVVPWFEMDRTEAPLGQTFTVTGYGLGPNASTNNYQIAWDNGYVGFMTGVKNGGTATAEIRAVGPPGDHVVQVWRNYRGVPYVTNNTQSPLGPVAQGRQSVWTVEVTEPAEPPRQAWVDPMPPETPMPVHYPDIDGDRDGDAGGKTNSGTEAELEISPESGTAGTDALITGSGFPADAEVDLLWYQHVGEGIRGRDVFPKAKDDVLPTVTADGDGRFQVDVEIPVAEGATRPIVAAVDGREVAVTGFMMQPSIETFDPRRGPVGTEIEIELTGVGWPNYENSPFFVYDNDLLGYGCGVSDDYHSTTVRTVLHASGQPGWHFIDIYPSLFKMEEDEPEFEVKPHLSYHDNHPVRPLPGIHLAFEITE